MKSMHGRNLLFLAITGLVMATGARGNAQTTETPVANSPQRYRKSNQPVQPISDTTIVAEAEEFQPGSSKDKAGWQAKSWGENYYSGTFANTFLSRQAFLGAPEQADTATASIEVEVPKAGRYLALVRYEAAPRFETQFHVRIEQNGVEKLNRLYGARDNLKVWAFKQGLKKEVIWDWGATENIVWEGTDVYVPLEAGRARITLVADKQPTPAAKRNVDLVMLTTDDAQVQDRIAHEGYLPLDGMLTQAGDVYVKAQNALTGAPVTITIPPCIQHSPYWVHTRSWKPKTVSLQPGAKTDWIEVGSLLDTLNDGQWHLTAKNDAVVDPKATTAKPPLLYNLEFGVRGADGTIAPLRRFANVNGDLDLAYFGDTRYSRRLLTGDEVLYDLVDYLKKQPVGGIDPRQTLIYGYTFADKPGDAKYSAARAEFIRLMGATAFIADANGEVPADAGLMRGYIDIRDKTPEQLEEIGKKLQTDGKADKIAVVSLGDEIALPTPPAADQSGFHQWLEARGLKAADVDATAGDDWSKIVFNISDDTAKNNPALFYYSRLYQNYFGIQQQKSLTDAVKKYLPNAGIGANFSPHRDPAFLGATFMYVTLFREGGMTMPWGEDYAWQVPIGSQEMNFIQLDLFRAGLKNKPDEKIHQYVMPHWPGNTLNDWRRQFYGTIGHGAKVLNLFEFRPTQAAYTENYVNLPAMYQEVRRGLHELGTFEDIVQGGQVRPATAGLWFSETGDIWNDNRAPFAAAKRTLYIAVRHQQLPLDMVVEGDDLGAYKVLYLADQHVSRAASQKIADWIQGGGHLFATAGAGMFDEFNQPNTILRELLGVEAQELTIDPTPIVLEKQDLPFAKPLDTVRTGTRNAAMPVFGALSRFKAGTAQVQSTFADGSPAVATRKVGSGMTTYVGFLPGLSYFKPALPLRPVDRGSTDDSLAHFIPTHFDANASSLIGSVATNIERPVVCSNPLVETTIIQAPQGTLIPLTNWSGAPLRNLQVTLNVAIPDKEARLASGKPLKIAREGKLQTFTFDLDVADALVLR